MMHEPVLVFIASPDSYLAPYIAAALLLVYLLYGSKDES